MFTSIPTERRNSPFKTHLQNCFRGWSVCNPGISKRGMAHILEMYALDEGLKVLQKTGGVKDESNKRQRKEYQQRTSEPLCCGLFVAPIVVCHPKSGTPPGSAISKGLLVNMYGLYPFLVCTYSREVSHTSREPKWQTVPNAPLGVKRMFVQKKT